MGRVIAPFGIKGWVRVQPLSDKPTGLAGYRQWWLSTPTGWQAFDVTQTQAQGRDVVAKLMGCEDRDEAEGFKGRWVAVDRQAFPKPAKGEYYWVDLVGLKVRNLQGFDLGVVSSLMETGANDVMVVQQVVQTSAQGEDCERLIPFIADVIKRVDIAAGLIEVDWGVDY
ncbi:MAG: ribosome maturation factor RimM [Betaproteobacteria bacterium]|jgi:16S rRNA processing protein RimM